MADPARGRCAAGFTGDKEGSQADQASYRSGLGLTSPAGVCGALELVVGALLLVGMFSRPVAFLLSGERALAYFMEQAGC
jgi:uncharacterized membrane protein YphA (DoxX/SURF4 family)